MRPDKISRHEIIMEHFDLYYNAFQKSEADIKIILEQHAKKVLRKDKKIANILKLTNTNLVCFFRNIIELHKCLY